MATYIYDQPDWPNFRWDRDRLVKRLAEVRYEQGWLVGRMEALGFSLRQEATLQTLTQDVVKTSEIEGEHLDTDQVRSSIARRLGIDIAGLKTVDRNVEGVVEMMLDATRNYDQTLTKERLFAWHASLFPTGGGGMKRFRVGAWRDDASGPMQVASDRLGRERVHFEAPPAERLKGEMQSFLEWFNATTEEDWLLKASLAHLWFVTIHPFDDGNGRFARAIADLALARSEQSAHRFYSMSAQIRQERAGYYDVLERVQRGPLDISPWTDWFLACLGRAIEGAHSTLQMVLAKSRFWQAARDFPFNERQRRVLNRVLDGFEGKLTTSKWARMAKCSQDTALRDIMPLVRAGILIRNPGGGRSSSYRIGQIGEKGS